MKPDLILASNSPRRKELLKLAGISYKNLVRETEETFPENLPLREVPVYLAKKKSEAYKDLLQENIILTADTIVILENEIIGKPKNLENAKQLLRKLSGKKHEVITGVCIAHKDKQITFSEKTDVYFKELTDREIDFYVENYKPLDKAGAYAIQEWIGAIAIEKIVGDVYNVIGLPIRRVVENLKEFGINPY